MKAIVLTSTEKDKFFSLVNEFYSASEYGSYEAFKAAENRNIVFFPLLNDLHRLSHTFLDDNSGLTDLKLYILNEMELNVREIQKEEIDPDSYIL